MQNPPKFFIPLTKNLKPEALYQSVKKYVVSQFHLPLKDRRIFKLECEHNGTIKGIKSEVQVGEIIEFDKALVIAIFESDDWYVLCTKKQGASRGEISYIDKADAGKVVEFID